MICNRLYSSSRYLQIDLKSTQILSSITPIAMTPNIYLIDPKLSQFGFKYTYKDRTGIWEFSPNLSPINRIINVPGVYEIETQTVKSFTKNKVIISYWILIIDGTK